MDKHIPLNDYLFFKINVDSISIKRYTGIIEIQLYRLMQKRGRGKGKFIDV